MWMPGESLVVPVLFRGLTNKGSVKMSLSSNEGLEQPSGHLTIAKLWRESVRETNIRVMQFSFVLGSLRSADEMPWWNLWWLQVRNGFIVKEVTDQNIFLIEVNICSVLLSTFFSLKWFITIDLQVARRLWKLCCGKLMIILMVSVIKGGYTVTMVTALRKLRIGVFNVLCETAGALATTTGTAMNARN